MRVPYCKTLILLSCKLLFTSIQSTTKDSVFYKMPSYDFSISSCSLNIFSEETEKNCMIFVMKKRHLSRQFSPQHYFLCADKFLWTFHGIDFNSISALVLCTFWIHVNTFYWLLAVPVPAHWMIQTSSVTATTLFWMRKNFGQKRFLSNEQIVKLYIITQLRIFFDSTSVKLYTSSFT